MSPYGRTACAVLAAVLALTWSGCGARHGGAADATPSTGAGTRVVEHEGVRVEVPASWERLDTSSCEWPVDRWGPAGTQVCDDFAGVAFYGSATFDPADRPGVRRGESEDGTPAWNGYVLAGDQAVWVVDDERAVVRAVLASARAG